MDTNGFIKEIKFNINAKSNLNLMFYRVYFNLEVGIDDFILTESMVVNIIIPLLRNFIAMSNFVCYYVSRCKNESIGDYFKKVVKRYYFNCFFSLCYIYEWLLLQ